MRAACLQAWIGGEGAVLQENERQNAPTNAADLAPDGGDAWRALCSSALSTADAHAVYKACA